MRVAGLRELGERPLQQLSQRLAGSKDSHENNTQTDSGRNREQPLLVELAFFFGASHVHQHDHEQEQHHDAARIQNDLNAGDKRRIQHQVNPREREQGENQGQCRVHRIAPRNYQNAAD